jgi:hypothetical protein
MEMNYIQAKKILNKAGFKLIREGSLNKAGIEMSAGRGGDNMPSSPKATGLKYAKTGSQYEGMEKKQLIEAIKTLRKAGYGVKRVREADYNEEDYPTSYMGQNEVIKSPVSNNGNEEINQQDYPAGSTEKGDLKEAFRVLKQKKYKIVRESVDDSTVNMIEHALYSSKGFDDDVISDEGLESMVLNFIDDIEAIVHQDKEWFSTLDPSAPKSVVELYRYFVEDLIHSVGAELGNEHIIDEAMADHFGFVDIFDELSKIDEKGDLKEAFRVLKQKKYKIVRESNWSDRPNVTNTTIMDEVDELVEEVVDKYFEGLLTDDEALDELMDIGLTEEDALAELGYSDRLDESKRKREMLVAKDPSGKSIAKVDGVGTAKKVLAAPGNRVINESYDDIPFGDDYDFDAADDFLPEDFDDMENGDIAY